VAVNSRFRVEDKCKRDTFLTTAETTVVEKRFLFRCVYSSSVCIHRNYCRTGVVQKKSYTDNNTMNNLPNTYFKLGTNTRLPFNIPTLILLALKRNYCYEYYNQQKSGRAHFSTLECLYITKWGIKYYLLFKSYFVINTILIKF